MRSGSITVLMGMATAVPFTVASASPAESERQFEEAMGWIAAGQPDAALPILRRLFRGTRAPRVRLELARALMLSGGASRFGLVRKIPKR